MNRWQCITALFTFALVGCVRERPPELVQTEARLSSLQSQIPQGTSSRIALERAEQELTRANREWKTDGHGADFDHFLYMSNRRMDIAQAQRETDIARNQEERLTDLQAANTVGRARLREEQARLEVDRHRLEMSRLQQGLESLSMQRTERGTEFGLTNVFFDVNSANLKPGANRRLEALSSYLRQHPTDTVTIEGYADSTGSMDHNQRLSLQRAETVKSMLVSQGVDPSRIVARGLGETYPQASNVSEAGRLQNRSVIIVLNARPL